MKNSAGEIRAATQQVAQQGGLPAETLQAIVENNTGYRDEQSPLPKHRQTGQTKEHQLLDTGLRYLEKLGEFNGNKVLALHAFNYGDKRTRQALKEGFSQEEADTVYSTLAREQKYGGEPLTHEAMTAMSGILGKPSKDLSKVAVSAPPKPIVPQITGTEGIEDSGSVDVPPYAVIDGKNIITVESRSNDSFGDGNPKNDGIQRVMYDDRSWNVYKNGELIETIPPKQSTAAVAQPSKQVIDGQGAGNIGFISQKYESGGPYVTGTQAVSTGNPVADAINKGDFIKIEKPDLTEVAKKIFQTKRKSRLPKYLSQAIKGGVI